MKHYKLLIVSICGLFGLTSCTINVITPISSSSETTTSEENTQVSATSEINETTSEVTSVEGVTSEEITSEEVTSEEVSSEEVSSEEISSEEETSSEETSSNIDTSEEDLTTDPYKNVSEYSFYQNYAPATSYMEAIYRSRHYLMSGSIEDQDQAPSMESNRPMSGSNYIKNTTNDYIVNTDGENVGYNILDVSGNVVDTIYLGGAYATLEEVAAYVYAFGEITANHISSKYAETIASTDWGKYCRGNFSYFSCDTVKYPDEPDLPDNYGGSIGNNNKKYYEMDIGTTGTDSDEKNYPAAVYNDGSTCTRGGARIVFTYDWSDETHIEDASERHVFYTYDHYGDFQEYLNYEGGWGTMFGSAWGNSMDYPALASSAF